MGIRVDYATSARASGSPEGRVDISGGQFSFPVCYPLSADGSGGRDINPEQLFAAGFAGSMNWCLIQAARKSGIILPPGYYVEIQVQIGPRTAGAGYGFAVTIGVFIPNMDTIKAGNLLELAKRISPYANMLQGGYQDISLKIIENPRHGKRRQALSR